MFCERHLAVDEVGVMIRLCIWVAAPPRFLSPRPGIFLDSFFLIISLCHLPSTFRVYLVQCLSSSGFEK